MSPLGKRMDVELFTPHSRITGQIVTHHIHVRDELNDSRLSILVFRQSEIASLHDMRAPRVGSGDAWLEKSEILLAIPYRIKGTTSMLTQRALQSRLGKNEHRLLLELGPFRVEGNYYQAGQLHIEDVLRRDRVPFDVLNSVHVACLTNPSISFVTDELAFNTEQVKMLCTEYEIPKSD